MIRGGHPHPRRRRRDTAVIWWIVAFVSVLHVGFTYLFGTHHLRVHVAVTGMVAASLSLVIVLIISLDRPFRGELSLSVEAYEM